LKTSKLSKLLHTKCSPVLYYFSLLNSNTHTAPRSQTFSTYSHVVLQRKGQTEHAGRKWNTRYRVTCSPFVQHEA
jgi:hypothetical protein